MTVTESAHPDADNARTPEKPNEVTITVNSADVTLPKGRYTGLQLKQAAIAQGVEEITLTFTLSVQHGSRYQVVGDTDVIEIHAGLDFVAVTGDDNS